MMRSPLTWFIWLMTLAPAVGAQQTSRYNTFHYSVNEGLLQTTIRDIAFDRNNCCWISFPKGIQRFDGKRFINIPVQEGLPDDQMVGFFSCAGGDLLLSHQSGISRYDIVFNRIVLIYRNPPGITAPSAFVGETGKEVYFLRADGVMTGIDVSAGRIVSEQKTGLPAYPAGSIRLPKFTGNIINGKIGINIADSVFIWDLHRREMLHSAVVNHNVLSHFLHLKTETEILFIAAHLNNALVGYDFTTAKKNIYPFKGMSNTRISRFHVLHWKNKVLVAVNNRVFEANNGLSELYAELVDYNNQPLAGASGISRIMSDHFGNLFVQTIQNGIIKVIGDNYPVKYYGTSVRQGNPVLSLLPDKRQNRVLAGTSGNGLLVYDTLQRLIKHIKTLPGATTPFSPNAIVKDRQGHYLLFNSGEKVVWQLKKDLSAMAPLPIHYPNQPTYAGLDFFGNVLYRDDYRALVQSQGKCFRISFPGNSVTGYEFTTAYVMGGLWHRNQFIAHGDDELLFMDSTRFTPQKKIPFPNTGMVRCFLQGKNDTLYAGSNNGIFIMDITGRVIQHLTRANGLPDNCIYAMTFDGSGNLWCSTNKGIFRLKKDNSVLLLTREDGLQENEFNTNKVAVAEDGELFFGGVNGISSFYPDAIDVKAASLNLFFTGIEANNQPVDEHTAPWNIDRISLPHHQNSLSFDFIAMGASNPSQYIYQYKMEGIDKEWIARADLQTVRYSLAPGKYVLHIYASRSFSKDAVALKTISIVIRPPFWKTWWFFGGIAAAVVAAIAIGINRHNRNRYQARLQALEHERQVKEERERMSKDLHDSLGAYANAVLYNTELLEQAADPERRALLMKDLKFASKDIITALRETLWALNSETYAASACLLRIGNFIQPFNRYYPDIRFSTQGDAPENLVLDHKRALHLVRMVQEAITNSIKHARATQVMVRSSGFQPWLLTVEDNGSGFDYTAMLQLQRGNGLTNMAQRAKEAGFLLEQDSQPGKGTSITIKIFA